MYYLIGWEVRHLWEKLRTVELRGGVECYLGILLRSAKRSDRVLRCSSLTFVKARRDKCYQRGLLRQLPILSV